MMKSTHARTGCFTLILIVGVSILGVGQGSTAKASELSASVSNSGSGSLCHEPLIDSSTVSPPSTATASTTLRPPTVCCGSGTVSAFASGGEIGGLLQMDVSGTMTNFSSQMAGCFDASMVIDDIVISGPGTEVITSVAIDVEGIISIVSDTVVGRVFIARAQLSGTSPGGGPVSSPFATTGNFSNSISTTLVTSPITVLTSQPLTVTVTLHGRAAVNASLNQSSSIVADFTNTVSFTKSGPVFSLPPRFTANSVDGNIVDNLFVSQPACPADLDGDGVVDFTDLALLLTSWAAGTTQGDIGGLGGCDVSDGVTDFFDLSCLLAAWAAGGCV